MISKLEEFKKSKDWQKDNGQFIPYPATWLNAKGWEDEVTEDKKKQIEDWYAEEYRKTGKLL